MKEGIVILLLASVHLVYSLDIFVSLAGNDQTGTGTSDNPFQSIGRAQTAVRSYQPLKEAVNVQIKGGGSTKAVYSLSQTLTFTSQDSGSQNYRITYRSQSGTGPVEISGGYQINSWSTSSSNPQLWLTTLPANVPPPRAFFINGQRRDVANTGILIYANSTATTVVYQAGQLPGNTIPYHLNETDILVYQNWMASKHPISSIDLNTRTITLKTSYNTQYAGSGGKRYVLENLVEAIKEGQFYYDSANRQLQYWSHKGEDPTSDCQVPTLLELVRVQGDPTNAVQVTDITFQDLSFVYTTPEFTSCYSGTCDGQSADFLTSATLHLRGASRINFNNVTVAHTGGYGYWAEQGTFNNAVSYAHFFDLGAGAVRLGVGHSGVESNANLRSEGNSISDSTLEDGGHIYLEGCGVLAQSVANTVIQHNNIHDFYYTGVSMGWTWGYAATSAHDNHIDYNNIYNIGKNELSDMGCVYTLGVQPGTRVLNNICHDVWSFDYGGWGLYTDEGSTNIVLSNNVVYHTKCAGFHQHYGEDNIIINNVFGDVNAAGNCDGSIRSSQWNSPCTGPDSLGACSSFTFTTNIVNLGNDSGVSAVYDSSPHGLDNMTFTSNDYWIDTGATSSLTFNNTNFGTWQANGKDKNAIVSNPLFVDSKDNNWWSLQPNSPALGLGFKPIDVSTVGPRPQLEGVAKNL